MGGGREEGATAIKDAKLPLNPTPADGHGQKTRNTAPSISLKQNLKSLKFIQKIEMGKSTAYATKIVGTYHSMEVRSCVSIFSFLRLFNFKISF